MFMDLCLKCDIKFRENILEVASKRTWRLSNDTIMTIYAELLKDSNTVEVKDLERWKSE